MKLIFIIIISFCIIIISSCTSKKIAQVNHVIHMGQSLAGGEESLPIVTDTINHKGNLMFAMGTRTWDGTYFPDVPEKRHDSLFQFKPLFPKVKGIIGETIANGLCDHFTSTSRIGGKLLFSYAGQGGRMLRELNKIHDEAKDIRAGERWSKGGYYKTSINDILRAKKTAEALNLSYSVLGIIWMQGEANGTLKIDRWSEPLNREEFLNIYKHDLIELKQDYDNDISKVLGYSTQVPFFTYQTLGNTAGAAQLMACDSIKDMYMVCPVYMFPMAENATFEYYGNYRHGDIIHLTADGQRWLGEQFGKVMKRVIIDKEDWQPLRPIKSYLSKNKKDIFVEFKTPRPPLVIDTLFLPKQGDGYGFRIYNNKTCYTIQTIAVVSNSKIKLTLEKPIEHNKELFLNYAIRPYVSEVSKPIQNIIKGKVNAYNHEVIQLLFEGNLLDEFKLLTDEGGFYLRNRVKDEKEFASLLINKVYLNNDGNTVLEGETNELRKNVHFKPSQNCYVSRGYAYGNLRDSDDEKSIYKFKDSSYGRRAGKAYPLYNWCVAFQDFPVIIE